MEPRQAPEPMTRIYEQATKLSTQQMERLTQIYTQATAKGLDPMVEPLICDIDAPLKTAQWHNNVSQCLTATRASNGGFWISCRGRRMSTLEMCRVQGGQYNELRVEEAGISERAFRHMIGNSMSGSVIQGVLHSVLQVMGVM